MNYIRSKKWLKELEKSELFFKKQQNINYYSNEYLNEYKSYVSDSIWDDINYQKFNTDICSIQHVNNFMNKLLTEPIYDKKTLQKRQECLLYFNHNKQEKILSDDISENIEWLLNINPITKNYIIDAMFPKTWCFKFLYWDPLFINMYHIYKSYWSPISQCIYPISIIFAPYIYAHKKLHFKISFKNYIKYIYNFICWLYKSSTDIKIRIRNITGLIIYIGLYLYSFIQVIDWSNQIRKYRNLLIQRLSNINNSILHFQRIIKTIPFDFWKPFAPNIKRFVITQPVYFTTNDFRRYWKNPNKRFIIKDIYKTIGIYEYLRNVSILLNKDWTLCRYNDYNDTVFGNMKHPELVKVIPNPINLSKNLIITGPNAAGKTTYVKSLLWNILLGQSFGIIRCDYGNINLYDAITHHDRIKDIIGSKSLFEAEMYKIKEVIDKSKQFRNIIYFLDEPLHSTPPIDGSAMLKAYLYYLACNNKNINIILTTHYHTIQELEKMLPNKFKNISMEAKLVNNKYIFPYLIKNGSSQQSIGIELLKMKEFPVNLILTAIKMKNKIYKDKINVS